jgi:spore coat protein CotH
MQYSTTQTTLKVLFLLFFTASIFAQDLPKFINITEDLREIKTESGDVTGFYNESKLRQIYLEFEDADFWTQLEDNYDTDVYVKATLKYKDEVLTDVGVQFKGNTSYSRLSDGAEKMSFSIKPKQCVPR